MRPTRKANAHWEEGKEQVSTGQVGIAVVADDGENLKVDKGATRKTDSVQNLSQKKSEGADKV